MEGDKGTRRYGEVVRRLWWAGAIVALALALGAWLGPYALSTYHLEAGGRALEAALVPVSPDRLAPEQVVDAERLDAGVAHLHQALRRDPRNARAVRLWCGGDGGSRQPVRALPAGPDPPR